MILRIFRLAGFLVWLLRYFTLVTERLDTCFALLGDRCIEALPGIRSCYGTELQFTPEKKSSQSKNPAQHSKFIIQHSKLYDLPSPDYAA